MENNLKTLLYFCFLILVTSSNTWDFNKGGADWLNSCKGDNQSPIDISQPFMYKKLNMTFTYANMNTEYLFYNDGNNLMIEGDFGYIIYNEKYYFSSQIIFYSSSMHTFSNKRLPLEMQVIHKDADGNNLVIVIMFKFTKDDYSTLLGKIGFDNDKLKYQQPYTPIKLKEEINLSKYLSEDKDFFMYEGLEALSPCKSPTTYLILSDVLKVSQQQLENFPMIIKNKNKIVQNRGERIIYTSFKIEELEEKKKEADEKLKEMEKEKKAFEKAEKIEEKIEDKLEKIESNVTLEKISEELSKLSNSTNNMTNITNDYSIKNISLNNTMNNSSLNNSTPFKSFELNTTNDQSDCDDVKIIPFEKIKKQLKAIEELTKVNDPKFLQSYKKDDNSIDIIKDLPDTEAEENKKLLEKQFIEWKNLYDNTKTSQNITPQNFIQMKILEKTLKQNKYEPYLKHNNIFYNDVGFTSFIQLKSSENIDKEYIDNKDFNKLENKDYEIILEEKQLKDKITELTNMILGKDYKDTEVSCNIPVINEENSTSLSKYNDTSVNNFLSLSIKEIENITMNNIISDNISNLSQITTMNNIETTNSEDLTLENSNLINKINSPSSSIIVTQLNNQINDNNLNNINYVTENINNPIESSINENAIKIKNDLNNYKKLKSLIHNNINNSNLLTNINSYINLKNNSIDNNLNTIDDKNLTDYLVLKKEINDSLNNSVEVQSLNINNLNLQPTNQVSNFLEDSIEITEITDNIMHDIKVETINDKLNENILKFEKLKGLVDVLDKTYEVKKEKLVENNLLTNISLVEPEIIVKSTNLFNTNIDYDINVYNIIKTTINELVKDYLEIDKINAKNNLPSLVDEKGNIIFILDNLATTIKATFNINENESQLKIEDKLNKLEKIITDLLVSQDNFKITNEISPEEINTIIMNIKNDDQYHLKSLSDQNQLKKLIYTMLKELPIRLAIKEIETIKEYDPDDIFITEENAKRLSNSKVTVYGPNVENQAPDGQGRKAVSKAGTVEDIEIFNTITWPNSCKYNYII